MTRIDEWPVRLMQSKVTIDGAINGQKIGIMLATGWPRTLILISI